MADFDLLKMKTFDGARNSSGNRLIAVFDMRIAGFKVVGCCLVEKANGCIAANGPWGQTSKGNAIKMVIHDRELRHALTERAGKMYEALTGRTLGANMVELAGQKLKREAAS